MAKQAQTVDNLELTQLFSNDDIKWFKRSLEKFKADGRSTYGGNLSLYEMFLISVSAVMWYPESRKMTTASYHDNDIERYMQKFVLENHPLAGERFKELSRRTISDENKRKYRWTRDRFVPRAFWDELYILSR